MLLGPSGSGKSTLLNILGGLDVPTSGRGPLPRPRPDRRRRATSSTRFRREHVGFVFQFYNLIPSLTARENVALVTEIAAQPDGPGRGAARWSASATACDHFPAQLSGGEQQRVAIARAIAKRPDVLLCDEPTGALDYATGMLVLEVLERVNRELGTTTAVITHNAAIAGDGRPRDPHAQRPDRRRRSRTTRRALAGGAGVVSARSIASCCATSGTCAGQVVAIALVVACGVAAFVVDARHATSRCSPRAGDYYAALPLRRRLRAAEARAASRCAARIAAIPGVAAVETRVVVDVTLDVPGLAEPATGRLVSIPDARARRC